MIISYCQSDLFDMPIVVLRIMGEEPILKIISPWERFYMVQEMTENQDMRALYIKM